MKRQTLTFAAILMGGLALTVSCTKENLFNLPEGAVMLTSESHVSHDKTSVSDKSVLWVGDGSESVTINGNAYTVNVSDGTAYILPGQGDAPSIIAPVYGYYGCENVTNPATTTPTVTVPGTYDCSYVGGRQILALPMVAYSSSVGSTIQFKQVTSAVKVMVRNEFNGVTLVLDSVVVSSNNYKLSGTVQVTLADNGGNPTVASQTIDNGTSSVRVNLRDATIAYNNICEVQVPILPIGSNTTPPNITVKAYAHDNSNYGHTYTYSYEVSASGLQLARNEMFTAKCRMSSETGHVDDFDARSTALTFEAKVAGATVTFTACTTRTINMEYSTDGGANWNTYTSGTAITLPNVGDKVLFRGDNTALATGTGVDYGSCSRFTCPNSCYIYGNIMSLLNKTTYATMTELSDPYTFSCLFYTANAKITNHPSKKLLLPAETLTKYCYHRLLTGTEITAIPTLPATTLVESCYSCMFYGCQNLTKIPKLPATTLANSCYSSMFCSCRNLTIASELPATTLADSCYYFMFQDCKSLTTAPELPATTLAPYCYCDMFASCSTLTVAPELPATTLARACYGDMFKNCTRLTAAPALPATTLAPCCYQAMFKGCTSLTTAPALPATTLTDSCYLGMFLGCNSLTTSPVLPATTLVFRCYYEMFRSCSTLTNVTCLATTNIDRDKNTYHWLDVVAQRGTFTKNASTPAYDSQRTGKNYWLKRNTSGIPNLWTVVDY